MSGWSEAEVAEVQSRFGMDRIQAIRHVQQRNQIQRDLRRDSRFNDPTEEMENEA